MQKKLISKDKSEFIKLTEKVQILTELNNPNFISSKEYLLKKVWNYNPNINTTTVETHIHRLRKKLTKFSKTKLAIKYEKEDIILLKKFGWGGRIRTYGTQDQNLLPYHLATPIIYF